MAGFRPSERPFYGSVIRECLPASPPHDKTGQFRRTLVLYRSSAVKLDSSLLRNVSGHVIPGYCGVLHTCDDVVSVSLTLFTVMLMFVAFHNKAKAQRGARGASRADYVIERIPVQCVCTIQKPTSAGCVILQEEFKV
ncbi:hypothetical protein RRG08_067005 [Elysia crispata]|uniref:Uncharacterized protein n=1 Tax=Elysia crispata TaxID=231223 RepID=A0AAE0Z9V5_9GAST|nr:hypothetical protein RRG08_067005 [Elysia crispata]